MQVSILYPQSREDFAVALRRHLHWHQSLEITWIATTPESFTEDCDQPGDLLLCLDAALLAPLNRPPREIWSPLLEQIHTSRRAAFFTWDELKLPTLLQRYPQSPATVRALRLCLGLWQHSLTAAPPLPSLLDPTIDSPGDFDIEVDLSLAPALSAAAQPWFEQVTVLEAHHSVEALLTAVLSNIVPAGRCLYLGTGYSGPLDSPPAGASLIRIRCAAPAPPANPAARALELIPLIPAHPDLPLPFSTFEFEQLLPGLFHTHWPIAERLAQRAGAFFRFNHRVPEAIWLYGLFAAAARHMGHTGRALDCDSELSWLEAGGVRKQQFLEASQTTFDF
ncbi:MAG: hypothetical protein ACK532_15645 [Acidobacteriota bacterium]